MAINTALNSLQAFTPAALPVPGLPKTGSSSSASFDALLSSLRSTAASPSAQTSPQAAAQLFCIEMMQNSLSLGDSGSAPGSGGLGELPALGELMGAPAGYLQAGQAASLFSGALPAPASAAAPAAAQAPAAAPAVPPDPGLGEIGSTAAQYLGTPYRFGGEGADGIDCSSFVQKVFREHQINLPRTAREQSQLGSSVAPGDLRKGDLVFFHTYASYPSHVGIYLGDGKMIHASSGKGEVTVSDLNSSYYRSRYLGAKRMA